MSKNNSLIDELPDTHHQFMIDLQGSSTKKLFKGEFACKIPTMKDQAMIAKHKAMLNGEFPVYLDPAILKLHEMIAYLRYTLTDYPIFWKQSDLGYELRDFNIIEAVYDSVLSFENEWLGKVWGQEQNESETKG
jgi:hypothetical protein